MEGFNSLQTGKAFRTERNNLDPKRNNHVSIPFKRERLSELAEPIEPEIVETAVSIPFKRERLSEQI